MSRLRRESEDKKRSKEDQDLKFSQLELNMVTLPEFLLTEKTFWPKPNQVSTFRFLKELSIKLSIKQIMILLQAKMQQEDSSMMQRTFQRVQYFWQLSVEMPLNT